MKTRIAAVGVFATICLTLLGLPGAAASDGAICTTDVSLGSNDTPYAEHLNSTGPFGIDRGSDGTLYVVVFTPIPYPYGGYYDVIIRPCGHYMAALVACLGGAFPGLDPTACLPG